MDSFIVLNITNDGKLLNPSNLPILYYQNENTENIILDMCKDDKFYSFFNNTCLNVENYHSTEISYFVYDIQTEKYKDYIYSLQNIFPITTELSIEYILSIFLSLYERVNKQKYNKNIETKIDIILDIFNFLKNKFKDRVSKETLKQYVISQLQNKLIETNLDTVIKTYIDIID